MPGDVTHESSMAPNASARPADESFRLTRSPSGGCRWVPDAGEETTASTTGEGRIASLKEHYAASGLWEHPRSSGPHCSLANS